MSIRNIHNRQPDQSYPGEYCPLPEEEWVIRDAKARGMELYEPPVNIAALPDHYRIEMPVPGAQIASFSIRVSEHFLSVSAVLKNNPVAGGNNEVENDTCGLMRKTIVLPDDADSDFATAGYANGVLFIYLYRGECDTLKRSGEIVVY